MTTHSTVARSWPDSVTDWNRGVACLSAAVLITRTTETPHAVRPEVLDAARAVLAAAGLDPHGAPAAGQLAAPVLQAAAMIGPGGFTWLDQPDEVLLAQGRASAAGFEQLAHRILSGLDGLPDRLARRGAAILDVGTGVAALAAVLAHAYPAATVTGLDVSERVLALARDYLTGHPAADRVHLRRQDVAVLDEPDCYDLAWIPAPFIPPNSLHRGVHAVALALRPGGWLLLGRGRLPDQDPLDDAVTRFITTAYGGTALTDTEAEHLLHDAGLTDVGTLPTPTGAPAMTVARRP